MPAPLSTTLLTVAAIFAAASVPVWVIAPLCALALANELLLIFSREP